MTSLTITGCNRDAAAECASLLFRVLADSDSDVAVLRAGETPYLVGPNGRRPLAHNDLSVADMRALVRHLLPDEERDALASLGAIRYELPTLADLPHERFTIDAELAQGDPVVAVRRLRVPEEDYVPRDIFPIASGTDWTPVDDSLSMPMASDLWRRSRANSSAQPVEEGSGRRVA